MISAPITDMAASLASMQLPNSYSKNQPSNDASSFGDIINNVTNTAGIDVNDSAQVSDAYRDRSQVMSNDAMNMASNKVNDKNSNDSDNKISNDADSNNSSNVNSESKSTVNNTSNKNVDNKGLDKETEAEVKENILNEVAEELDITVDELEDMLAQMGLTAFDLLNPQNVNALVANVKADGDMMSIVTDENLSNLVNDINVAIVDTLENVSKELGISIDELNTKINETVMSKMDEMDISTKTDIVDEVANDDNLVVNSDSVQKIVVNGDLKSREVSDDNAEETQVVDLTNADDTVNEINENNQAGANSNDNAFDKSESNKNVNNDNLSVYAQNAIDTPVNFDSLVSNVLDSQANESMHMTNAEDIINQINEHLKAQMKADITEIQMQLNPENLGTVHLTLASKESGVTAQLAAQNESVKAALESQVATLKQNLEQQGVKVEAVEVTVASHEFERNLDQGNERNQAKEDEAERLRKATRKINVDGYFTDEDLDGLDETEVVTAKMMKADGNSMDYKV